MIVVTHSPQRQFALCFQKEEIVRYYQRPNRQNLEPEKNFPLQIDKNRIFHKFFREAYNTDSTQRSTVSIEFQDDWRLNGTR